ncbi:phosphohydrolase [Altererythrobacter salegens]|uniref:Phosphohydrolase n=1 Tax=Croceibacterium salegens TaxID=1737568 RepID=A0A6I4SZ70_9SPHN|nr:metallophosphoesterase [Croceibacterium salegens]MXO60679.1 phosphohydrolase [Croceibacterium salegens]
MKRVGGARRWSRRQIALLALLACVVPVVAKAWHDTMADPVVNRTSVALRGLDPADAPLTIALLSDIHVAGPDMPPERLERIVAKVNALKPDLVLIAGDLVSEKRTATHIYTPQEVVAPLGALRAPLGVFVVPGNHDHWFDLPALSRELQRRRIRLLANEAVQTGPLVVGGLDDAYTGAADLPMTLAAMDRLEGARIVFGHSPDTFPQVPSSVPLMFAGHTHCGQIAYPWGGAPAQLSNYGDRYGCGRIDEDGKTLVVGAGLGTSLIPVRLFTHPEIWLIELRAK